MNNPPTDLCPDCQHPHHLPGTECETRVHHGRNFHVCLCLARPGAALPCPPQMTCQGGTLGYTDIWYLQRGHSLSGADGVISPEVLRLDPTRAVPAGLVAVPPTTTDRCVCGDPTTPDTFHRTDGPCYAVDARLRVAALAIARTEAWKWADGERLEDQPLWQTYLSYAAAVLAVLPAGSEDTTTTRADVYRELADQQTQLAVADDLARRRNVATARRQLVKELRRLAAETQPAEPEPGFVARVLEIFSASHADAYGDLFWSVDDGQVHLFANVSDVFAWGGADCEPITPETLPALEQAYADLKAVEAEEFTADLYAARQRGMRPQGAAYPSGTHESWRHVNALYDACGPERPLGLGNPKAPPAAASAGVQTDEETSRG